jgi:hypothetical protein
VVDEQLVLFMQGDLKFPMIPIGDDHFLVEGSEGVLVTFDRDESGAVVAASSHHHGIEERYPRNLKM